MSLSSSVAAPAASSFDAWLEEQSYYVVKGCTVDDDAPEHVRGFVGDIDWRYGSFHEVDGDIVSFNAYALRAALELQCIKRESLQTRKAWVYEGMQRLAEDAYHMRGIFANA